MAAPSEGLTLSLGVGYTDAKIIVGQAKTKFTVLAQTRITSLTITTRAPFKPDLLTRLMSSQEPLVWARTALMENTV